MNVRPLRRDEERLFLEIRERAIRGLAATHYSRDVIEAWVTPATDENVRRLMRYPERDILLVVELNGKPCGIGALSLKESAIRKVYVAPEGARRGCGSALVHEMERIARSHKLARLGLSASLNAVEFYAGLGYEVLEREELQLPNGPRMAAVRMVKDLRDPHPDRRIALGERNNPVSMQQSLE